MLPRRIAPRPALAFVTLMLAAGTGDARRADDSVSAVVGLDTVSIGSSNAVVDSFDSSRGPYGENNKGLAAIVSSNGPIAIDGATISGDVRSATSSVTLKKSSAVTGNVLAGTSISNSGAINGSATANSPTAPIVAPPVAACAPFTAASAISGTFSYDAGLGDLAMNGGDEATLAPGTYCFHNLTVTGRAKLTVNGAASVRLTGEFKASGGAVSSKTSQPSSLQISSSFEGHDGVNLSGTSDIYVSMYAPRTDISLTGDAQLYGAALGKTLRLSGRAAVHFDTRLAVPPNSGPVVNAGPNTTITLPASATLRGSALDDGLPSPPGALTYQWAQVFGPAAATLATPTRPDTVVNFPSPGTYTFRLTVGDGALSASATTDVLVNAAVNQPPVVTAGENQTITLPATAALMGTVTDDGLPGAPAVSSAAWSQVSGPVPALVADPTRLATSATFVQPGTYVLALTARDGALSASSTTVISVLDGGPSLAPLPDRVMPVGSTFTARLAATDGNANDTLTYFLDEAPAGTSFSPNPVLSWTPTAAHLGSNVFTARVVDAGGQSDTRTFRVTVTPANQPPALEAQADQQVPTGGRFTRTLAATDPDGDTLTFGLVAGPAGLTLSGQELSWSPITASAGTYPVTVKVADGGGLIDSTRFNISVFAASSPVAHDDSYSVALGQTLSVAAPGLLSNDADPEGGSLTVVRGLNPDKGVLSALNTDGSFLYTAPSAPNGPVLDVAKSWDWSRGGALEVAMSPPLVADVTGDGKPEILVFEYNSDLYVLSGETHAVVFHASALPSAQIGGANCSLYGMGESTYAVADIDDDGQVDVVLPAQCGGDAGPVFAAGMANRVVALTYDPTLPEGYRVKWITAPLAENSREIGVTSYDNFTIARLRPTEKPSVLFGQSLRGGQCQLVRAAFPDFVCRVVFALNGQDGSINRLYYAAPSIDWRQLGGYWERGTLGFMAPVVADVDADGEADVLFQGTLWSAGGAIKRQFDGSEDTGPATLSSAVVDLDGDSVMEIVTLDVAYSNTAGSIKAWKPDGRLLWWAALPRTTLPTHLTIADVDRDGRPDMIAGLGNVIWVFDDAGRVKWMRNMSTAADGGSFQFNRSAFPVYDLNGDGVPEMILQYGRHTIRFLRADTGEDQIAWTYPGKPTFESSGNPANAPIVADVDGSGQASVVWYHDVQFDGTSMLQVMRGDSWPWRPAPAHLNQAAYWETNFGADGSVPTTYDRHTENARTNIAGHQPQAPYAANFVPASQTTFTYAALSGAGVISTPATVTIAIDGQANHPPCFSSKPPKFYVTGNVDYFAVATDPDPGDTISYALVYVSGNHSGLTLDATTGRLTIFGLYQFSGDQSLIIAATDSRGATGYQNLGLRWVSGMATVPNVVGQSLSAAIASLTGAQLAVGDVVRQFNAAIAGTVIGQTPDGGTGLPNGESVALTVSLGAAPVPVPNVVGASSTAGVTTLAASGFATTTTRVFSNTVAEGAIVEQIPPAGALQSPGPATPIALTVSAGNGLTLALNRSVTTADQPIVVTPSSTDLDGNPAAMPMLTYTVAPSQATFIGPLPTVSGTTITPAATTLGSFTLIAADAATGRSARAEFAVLSPRTAGTVTNSEVFAHLAEVLDSIHALKPALQAARAANDTAGMTSLLQQIVVLWRTIDLDELRISQPMTTPDQFMPTIDMLPGLGVSATPDDVILHRVLLDAIADLTAWTKGLKTRGFTATQLDALADQFATRAARIDGLAISLYGGVSSVSQYTRLMTQVIPAFYETLANELAVLTGLPPRSAPFLLARDLPGQSLAVEAPVAGDELSMEPKEFYVVEAPELHAEISTSNASLAELTITFAVQQITDKIMGEAKKLYMSPKEFYVIAAKHAAYSASVVIATNAFRARVSGRLIDEVVSGASLSFREFQQKPGWVEANADDDPSVNVVMVIGPELFNDVNAGVQDIVAALQKGYSQNIDPATNPNRYRNANQIRKDLSQFTKVMRKAIADADALIAAQAEQVFLKPADTVLYGCVFSSDPACRQLIYDYGFPPVYVYKPREGFTSLGGVPVPIVFMVYNAATGVMYFATPPFLPCVVDPVTNQVKCPNNQAP